MIINHRAQIVMGVVRQEVKMSAGYCGFMGRVSSARHAASTILPEVSIPTLDPTINTTQSTSAYF